jgi:N-acetylglutamate synthase
VRYRMEVRLTPDNVGGRVVVRWRRPGAGGGEEVADVLGILEAADAESFQVRKSSGELVTIPRERALAAKPVPGRGPETPRQARPRR